MIAGSTVERPLSGRPEWSLWPMHVILLNGPGGAVFAAWRPVSGRSACPGQGCPRARSGCAGGQVVLAGVGRAPKVSSTRWRRTCRQLSPRTSLVAGGGEITCRCVPRGLSLSRMSRRCRDPVIRRRTVMTQSTWKKSQASMVAAGVRGNCRHVWDRPTASGQPPVPAQQRVWRDQAAHPQRPWEQPGQGGEHRPAGPVQPRFRVLAPQHPRPPHATPAARHPSTPPTVSAAPSRRSAGRTSGRASVSSQARDHASPTATWSAYSQVSYLCPVLEPHRALVPGRRFHCRTGADLENSSGSYGVMLIRRAAAAASVRLVTPSLARMWEMWTLTVFSLMNRSSAMRRLLSPSARSVSTCRSR
jgi:hypothetical protein